jgi:hypothetical protein
MPVQSSIQTGNHAQLVFSMRNQVGMKCQRGRERRQLANTLMMNRVFLPITACAMRNFIAWFYAFPVGMNLAPLMMIGIGFAAYGTHKGVVNMTRLFVIGLALAASLTINPATALQGWTDCHGAGTTVTSISGFDTRRAKMVSEMTLPDATQLCHRDRSRADGSPKGVSEAECASNIMRDGVNQITVWGNCEKATLTMEYLPASGSKHVTHFKFPVFPDCGSDGAPAITAFKTLCPSYEWKLELD